MNDATKSIGLILLAVVTSVYSNVVLKARATSLGGNVSDSSLTYVLSMARDPWVWSAAVATGVGMLLSVIALRQLELSVAQPIFSLIFVLVPLAAVFFLGEQLPPLRIVGLVLIFVGVVLVAQTA
jgi:multidrug transporter EmrE-like cation transporter